MKSSKKEKKYIVNKEFNSMASCLVKKYPEIFLSVSIQKVCCVNEVTSEKSHTGTRWKLHRVKMPMALHCPYGWYVIFKSAEWDEWNEGQKMCMVGDVLMCLKDFELD